MKFEKCANTKENITDTVVFIDTVNKSSGISKTIISKLNGKNAIQLNQSFRNSTFIIILVLSGRVTVESNLSVTIVDADNILLVAPNSMTKIIDASEDSKMLYIRFSDLISYGNIKNLIQHNFYIYTSSISINISKHEKNKIISIAKLLQNNKIFNSSNIYDAEIINCILKLLLYDIGLIYRNKFSTTKITKRSKELSLKFIESVDLNFKEERNIDFYADQLCITKGHLTRVLRDFTGKSPNTLIEERVVNESCLLLTSTALTVREISLKFNFSDQSSFGKFFKKNTGFSPSEYRRRNDYKPL